MWRGVGGGGLGVMNEEGRNMVEARSSGCGGRRRWRAMGGGCRGEV